MKVFWSLFEASDGPCQASSSRKSGKRKAKLEGQRTPRVPLRVPLRAPLRAPMKALGPGETRGLGFKVLFVVGLDSMGVSENWGYLISGSLS